LSLSWSHDGTLDKEEIVVDDTVMWETTEWGDVLDMWIVLGRGIVVNTTEGTSSDLVYLLVKLCSVVVTQVTDSSNSPLNSRWMPSTDTSNLSETSMSLSWKSGNLESLDNTLSSLTSGNGNGINHLILVENISDLDVLLEVVDGPLNLILNLATVDLDFHNVSFLLSEVPLLGNVSGAKNSDNRAVFLNSLNVSADVLLVGFGITGVFLA